MITTPKPRTALTSRRVLIIDSNSGDSATLSAELALRGERPTIVSSEIEAENQLRQSWFHVAVYSPGISQRRTGQVVEQLKQRCPILQVVLRLDVPDEVDVVSAIAAGACDIIDKAAGLDAVLSSVDEVLDRFTRWTHLIRCCHAEFCVQTDCPLKAAWCGTVSAVVGS